MAKNKLLTVTVETREEANEAMAHMARLAATIAEHAKAEAEEKVQREAVEYTYATHEKAIIAWAKKDRKTWEGKTLALMNGTISFQVSPGKVGVIKGIVKGMKAVEPPPAGSRVITDSRYIELLEAENTLLKEVHNAQR